MQGEKRETSNQNLQRNNVARQIEGFCILYFASLTHFKVAPYSFLTARELVSKSHDGASLKKIYA